MSCCSALEEQSFVNLPVKYLDLDGKTIIKEEPWPIIDIHSTMAYLFEEAQLHVPPVSLEAYWKQSKAYGEPWAQEIDENDMRRTIPIGIYGGSARVDTAFGSEHILAFFTNVIHWRPRSVRWSRFLVCAISEERLTSETIPAILRRIVWSANHAFEGFFPKAGPFGEALSGVASKQSGKHLTSSGLKFQVTELRGDWSFHKKIWKFAGKCHWNGEHVCHLCSAKGISQNFEDLYFNIENPNHEQFSLTQFLARRIPTRQV